MGKKSSGSSDRKSQTAKAGKRHGAVHYPATATKEKLAAQEKGEQQFVAKKQMHVPVERTVIEWDKNQKKFVYKTKTVQLSTEFILDPRRGRIVYSPSFKEKN